MQTRNERIDILKQTRERPELSGDERAALDAVISEQEFQAEGANVEDFNNQKTIVVELSDGYTYQDEQTGTTQHADVVRLRRPSIRDEWRRDAVAVSKTAKGEEPSPTLLEMALVVECIVEWKGIPLPSLEHVAALSRYDGGRLYTALQALEMHCEREAASGKLKRRSKSQSD